MWPQKIKAGGGEKGNYLKKMEIGDIPIEV